jgi:transcriptional regulator with XRE-family HTH domain
MTTDDTPRMTGGEMQTVREYLGLTTESLAGILGVRHDTVRRWESGRDPIPYRVREEVEQIEAYTAHAVDDLVRALSDARDPAVVVYRTDADMHAARTGVDHLPARWWRHVVARAAHEIPGVAIGTRGELEV